MVYKLLTVDKLALRQSVPLSRTAQVMLLLESLLVLLPSVVRVQRSHFGILNPEGKKIKIVNRVNRTN